MSLWICVNKKATWLLISQSYKFLPTTMPDSLFFFNDILLSLSTCEWLGVAPGTKCKSGILLSETIGYSTVKPIARCGVLSILLLLKENKRTSAPNSTGYFHYSWLHFRINGKNLLLKTTHSLNMRHKDIQQVPIWKHPPCWLGFIKPGDVV